MKRYLNVLLAVLLGLLLWVFISFLSSHHGPGFGGAFIIGLIVLTVFGYQLRARSQTNLAFWIIFALYSSFLFFYVHEFNEQAFSFPLNLMKPIALFSGYTLKSEGRFLRRFGGLMFFLMLTFGVFGYHRYSNFLVYGKLDLHEPVILAKSCPSDACSVKYTVIEAWNFHCGICIKQLPEFAALKDEYSSDNTRFISLNYPVSSDTLFSAQESLLEEFYSYGLTVHAFEKAEWPSEFDVHGFPNYFVVENGRILRFKGPISELEEALQRIR